MNNQLTIDLKKERKRHLRRLQAGAPSFYMAAPPPNGLTGDQNQQLTALGNYDQQHAYGHYYQHYPGQGMALRSNIKYLYNINYNFDNISI